MNLRDKFKMVKKEELKMTPQLWEEQTNLDMKRHEWIHREQEYFSFSKKFETSYDLKKGEIYEFDWGMNVNAEFSGRHYGVVLRDSPANNPLVLVCPLKTNHKVKINFNSDYYVGHINGLPRQVESVAVMNQVRTMDKMRIYTRLAIGSNGGNKMCSGNSTEYTQVIRLSDHKLNKIITGVAKIVFGLNPFDTKDQGSSGND